MYVNMFSMEYMYSIVLLCIVYVTILVTSIKSQGGSVIEQNHAISQGRDLVLKCICMENIEITPVVWCSDIFTQIHPTDDIYMYIWIQIYIQTHIDVAILATDVVCIYIYM